MIVALGSWALTLAFVAFALRAHLRLVLVARACHELRGPLFAVQLGLHGLAGDPARMAAIELELARAGRALDDLAAAPRGRRGPSRRKLVDVDALVESYAPAWRTLAAAYGATLHVARVSPVEVVWSGAAQRCALTPDRSEATVLADPPPRALAADAGPGSPAAVLADPAPRALALDARYGSPATGLADPPPHALAPDAGPARPAAVLADPLRIAQACANLVGNAAEHGGGVVRVRVRATGEVVRIEVADDGPGLPASVAALTAAARARRGHRGHGLAIAAAVAAEHGGRLVAAPSYGGARLLLELPAASRPRVAA